MMMMFGKKRTIAATVLCASLCFAHSNVLGAAKGVFSQNFFLFLQFIKLSANILCFFSCSDQNEHSFICFETEQCASHMNE